MNLKIQKQLLIAIKNKNLDEIKAIIDQNKDIVKYPYFIDDRKQKENIIHYLAARGYTEIIAVLHQLGFDINILDRYQETALSAAAHGLPNAIDSFNFLLSHVDKKLINHRSSNGNTALHIAARHNPTEIEINQFVQQKYGNAKNGAVQKLISAGAKVDQQNQYDQTPLHLAIEDSTYLKNGQINNTKCLINLACLIELGANLNIQNSDGNTVLHLATRLQDRDIIKLLITAGADLYVKNNNADNPLNMARKFKVWNTTIESTISLLEEAPKIAEIIKCIFADSSLVDYMFSPKDKIKIVNFDLLKEWVITNLTNYIPIEKKSSKHDGKIYVYKSKEQILKYIFDKIELSKEQATEIQKAIDNSKLKFAGDDGIPTLKCLAMSVAYEASIEPGLHNDSNEESKELASAILDGLFYYVEGYFTSFINAKNRNSVDTKNEDIAALHKHLLMYPNSSNSLDEETFMSGEAATPPDDLN